MGVLENIFSKKKSPPSSITPETKDSPKEASGKEEKEVKRVKTKSGHPKPKKQPKEAKVKGPFEITFYGKPVRRYFFQKSWYFSLDDIEAIAEKGKKKAKKYDPEKLSQVKQDNLKELTVGETSVEAVDYRGALEVSRYVNGVYPGPFARWIEELVKIPFIDEDSRTKKKKEIKKAGQVHPSDSGIS